MKKSHLNFTKNLDNNYKKTTSSISENIASFNRDIVKFIYNNFNISNKSEFSNKSEYKTPSNKPYTYSNESRENIVDEYIRISDPSDNLENDVLVNLNTDPSDNLENDVSGNLNTDPSDNLENDVSGNLNTDPSGNLENDVLVNLNTDPSGNLENDVSGNLNTDPSGNLENDESNNEDAEKNNIPGEDTNKTTYQSNTIDLYRLPELNFNTNKKLLKKFYKKLIVKLHPDKREKDSDPTLFQEYFEECKHAMEIKCIYKLWLLTFKMKITVKITRQIENAILTEINLMNKYISSLTKSPIYKWISSGEKEKVMCIKEYISKNMLVL